MDGHHVIKDRRQLQQGLKPKSAKEDHSYGKGNILIGLGGIGMNGGGIGGTPAWSATAGGTATDGPSVACREWA